LRTGDTLSHQSDFVAMKASKLLRWIGPGVLVAATGVGAGDLATASFTGSELGLAVLWAVIVGAFLKFVLNEGLTRWQLTTGSTLLEGAVAHLGRGVQWGFLVYLVAWSFLVGAALMSAMGVVCHAIWPLADSPQNDKVIYGIAHSLLAVALVRLGGYPLFERVMGVCIAAMFIAVVATATALRPPMGEILSGIFLPTVPSGGVLWTVALMGGVGGTVTVLCYGYWIREEGREGIEELRVCRVDLATAYAMTAVFGVAMVAIGASLGPMEGGGATLMVRVATRLQESLGSVGPGARWVFLAGAWAAVFSSMLGVWQSTPYLFADLWRRMGGGTQPLPKVDTRSRPYQIYLFAIALLPILGLVAVEFRSVQKWNGVVGALFIPMLAGVLLYFNGSPRWVGERHRNSWLTTGVLAGALVLFAAAGALEIRDSLWP
jgi:Mn2+/Fe2+ NRAMP family transporter